MRSCPSHSQAVEVFQPKYQLNLQLRGTGKWFPYNLELIPFSSAGTLCTSLYIIIIIIITTCCISTSNHMYTPHTLFRFHFFRDYTEIKPTTATYYRAVTKRFQVLQSLCKMVKTTQLIPQSTDFLEDGSNHAKCLHFTYRNGK